MQAAEGVELKVRLSGSDGPDQTIGFFRGSNSASIRKSIATALEIPSGVGLVARDVNGNVVALSDRLPSGLVLSIEAVDQIPASSTAGNDDGGGGFGSSLNTLAEALVASVRGSTAARTSRARTARSAAFRGQVRRWR